MLLRTRISLTVETGQTMAEYAFVLSVIILTVFVSLTLLSEEVASGFAGVVEIVKNVS